MIVAASVPWLIPCLPCGRPYRIHVDVTVDRPGQVGAQLLIDTDRVYAAVRVHARQHA